MCKTCLLTHLPIIAEYEEEVKTFRAGVTCECCKSYYDFLLEVNMDYKVLCLTKIKRCEQVCPNGIRHYSRFEEMVKLRIKNKLTNALDIIDEGKDEIHEGQYLAKMNELKDLNDLMASLEKADHR
jgi:ferredoxin